MLLYGRMVLCPVTQLLACMEILSVTLNNFKSHSDRQFVFQPGTNAICGENGAGKTSILEAIAWVLFDYAGDYTKEDLIRNGAASAQVRVVFVSNRDGRTYEVQRCTNKSYTLYDPQLNERLPYSRIKEDVLPWLRQQFGVSAGTDLSQLFSSTIGVPQGTFTADFLNTKEKRKATFDKILKVEEYQQTWKKLNDLEKFAKAQVETLERDIARYDEELAEFEVLLAKYEAKQQEIAQVQQDLAQTQRQVATLSQEQEQLAALAQRSQQIENQLAPLTQQLHRQTRTRDRLQEDLTHAEAAVALCTTHREAYHAFQQAEEALRLLEHQRRSEQTLLQQKRQQEQQLQERQTALTKVMLQRDRLDTAHQSITTLQPLADQQTELEQAQQRLSQGLQTVQALHHTLNQQTKQRDQLHNKSNDLSQTIAQLQTLAVSLDEIPTLEAHRDRLQQHLSRIAAATQFTADLHQLLQQTQTTNDEFFSQVQQAETILNDLQQAVPRWQAPLASILATLQSGITGHHALADAVQAIVDDLTEQTDAIALETQLKTVQTKLQTLRHTQAQVATLDRLQADQADLAQEMQNLETQLADLHTQLSQEAALRAEQAELTAQLAQLNNPKGQIQLLQTELQQEATLHTQIATLEAARAELEQAIAHLDAQLREFATLPDEIHAQQLQRDTHRAAYETYMKHREVANSRKKKLQDVQEATAELEHLTQTQTQLTEERDRLRTQFDPAHFQTVQTAYQQATAQQAALAARLPDMQTLLTELDHQLARLTAQKTKRAEAQAELDRKKKSDRFIKFARKAYKEAAPRITERYIQTISREADKLFRELLNRANVSLQWTRDYEIIVQEGAHSRRFVNLSGGEQMCAALAVRLALLKILADIDIAFFDEPTTNMDRPRRAQLAEAIANIKTFRQLFVISHDDTFETITENIIVVHREI
jgi:DNA repair protein SbcC/Rad50